MPATKLDLLWTLARYSVRNKSVVLMTQGLGPQPFHGNIMILVNEWTNSAGEMVGAFAQENGLATTIGCKTAGNVLGAINYPVGSGYLLRLPIFGWYTSKSRCLEGAGSEPDVRVATDGPTSSSSEGPQLEAALRQVTVAYAVHKRP